MNVVLDFNQVVSVGYVPSVLIPRFRIDACHLEFTLVMLNLVEKLLLVFALASLHAGLRHDGQTDGNDGPNNCGGGDNARVSHSVGLLAFVLGVRVKTYNDHKLSDFGVVRCRS